MKLTVAIALALTFVPTGGNPGSFELDSTDSTYPFVGRITGRFSVQGDSLVIEVSGGRVTSHIPTDLGEQGVAEDVSVAFGLGRADSDSWAFEHDTDPQVVGSSLKPGASATLGVMRFAIRRVDTLPLQDRWLVAQILVHQHLPGIKAGLLASYVCAEDNLKGPTSASRERAAKMHDRYSETC